MGTRFRIALKFAVGLVFVAGFTALAPLSSAAAYIPHPCVGGTLPVATFRLMVAPPKGGEALPVSRINLLRKGDTLKYEPILLPSAIREHSRIAIIVAPATSAGSQKIEVLKDHPAKAPAEWKIPMRASVVGVVFGPHGLSEGKVNSLVKKNPELVPELAAYAKKTATVNALVNTLSQYEQSQPGSEDLSAALKGFSSQYGVVLPRLTPGAPTDEQASVLLQALVPAMGSYDPLTSSRSAVVQQSAGLAASVASLFYGTPIGLAAGGAALFSNLHTMMFPGTDFRSAFTENVLPIGTELCAKDQQPVPRTRIAYLWMLKVPDLTAPSVSISGGAVTLPIASNSTVQVKCATNAEMRTLLRARDWRLVSGKHSANVPAKVTVGSETDSIALDLDRVKLPPGNYQLAALWDWQPMKVTGTIYLRHYSDFSSVTPTAASKGRLISGAGIVPVDLTGADFEFVKQVQIEQADGSSAQDLTFKLPKGLNAGDQPAIVVDVDTTSLAAGNYHLLLTQTGGKTQAVAINILPPNPQIDGLPLRVNLGESSQTLTLHGTGLGRIVAIHGNGATWKLEPASSSNAGTRRSVTVSLAPDSKVGQILDAEMSVEGVQDRVEMPRALLVAPPRPEIVSVSDSFPNASGVALRQGEIPSGSAVSFALHTDHIGAKPSVAIGCANPADTKQALSLTPGDQSSTAQLDYAGEGVLFLSLDPGSIGQSGCELTATINTPDAGASKPTDLGQIIRLPEITKFSLSDKKINGSLYEGILTGQDLQMIAKAGWNSTHGYPVAGIPTPVPGNAQQQTLTIALPWPPPAPGAPVYVWLRGENRGRKTHATY